MRQWPVSSGTVFANKRGVEDSVAVEPAVGLCVSHNLTLVRPLGSGAMASVWLAQHRTLGIQRAVKFLSPELAEDEAVAERFHREGQSLARIQSPHVVEVFDSGWLDDGTPFIVTELLEGEDLAERITREGQLSLEETAILVEHVARALEAAHAQAIVHRDLKPGNIFITGYDDDPCFKVLDFGIAKDPEPSGEERITITKTGHAMGTPGFMSPEQWLNAKGVSHASDLWALGAVAYCAVTSEIPFDAETPAKAMLATCAGNVPAASGFNADVPPELDAWFDKAMHRHPEGRFGSAMEMARSFSELVAEQHERVSLSDRPTTMLPERAAALPSATDSRPDSGAHRETDTLSVPPVALSTPPASAGPSADATRRRHWRRRAGLVTGVVLSASVMTAALAILGATTSYDVASHATPTPTFTPAVRSAVYHRATAAPAQQDPLVESPAPTPAR